MQTFIQTRTQLMQQITETELVKEVSTVTEAAARCTDNTALCRCIRPKQLAHCILQQDAPSYVHIQELGRLDDSATVYKLIGPAMIKQDLMEANTNVAKRLEYIQGEVKRITNKLAELEGKAKEQQQLVSVLGV